MHRPTRRQVLELAVAAGVGAGTSFADAPSVAAPPRTPTGALPPPTIESFVAKVRELQAEFRSRVAEWVRDDRLVRPDGYVYAVDVAQLMACFADSGNVTLWRFVRATMPPVSVDHAWPLTAWSIRRVPVVRARFASM